MKKPIILIGILAFVSVTLILVIFLDQEEKIILNDKESSQITFKEDNIRIASWLAKKDEIISSGKPYDLIMTGWVTPEEANIMRANNPDVLILAGLTTKFVYDSPEWMSLLTNVANYGKKNSILITEDMYLKRANGERCSFGWASEEFATSEIYAMDPRNDKWADLVVSFYEKVLEQPQHDGIIIDMVTEWVPCEDARISKQEWIDFDKKIMGRIKKANKDNKLIIFNSGKD